MAKTINGERLAERLKSVGVIDEDKRVGRTDASVSSVTSDSRSASMATRLAERLKENASSASSSNSRGNKLPEGFFDTRPAPSGTETRPNAPTQSTPEAVKATVGDFVQAIGGMGNKSGKAAEEEAFQADLTSIASDGKITLEDIRTLHELHPAVTEDNAYGLYSLYASRLTEDELKKEAPTISQELYNLFWTPEMQTEYDGLSEVTNAVNAKKATANPTNFDQKGVGAKQTAYTPTEAENNAVKKSAEMAVAKNNAESAKSYMEYLLSREWERSQYKKKYGQEWYDASGKISDNATASRIVIDMLKDRYNRQAESGSGYATPYELDEMYKKASRGEATVEDVKKVAERYSDTKLTDEDVARLGTMYKGGKSGAWSDYYEDFVYPRVSDEVRRKKSAEYDAVTQNGNFGERLVSSVGGLLSSVGLSVPAAIESVDSAITSNIKKADFPVYKEKTGYGRLSSTRTGIDEGRKTLGTDINADVLESFGMEREKAEAIGGTAYDIENSIAENLVRMPLGATFGSFVMLSQSFASEYQSGVDRFEDPTKNAVRSGILSALEAGTEAIQIKGLEKVRLKNTAFEPNLIKRIGKGAVLGGVNETPSELVNYYSGVGLDVLLNGENSEFYKEMYSRVASGKNDSYAGAAASILAEGTGNTALSSFISGSFLGGINSTFSYSGTTRADLANFGKEIQKSGVDFNLLVEQAKTSKTDVTRELARSIEAAQKKGKTIPDEALGMLYYYAENDAQRGEINLEKFAESMAFSSLGKKIIDDGISNDVIASALNSSNSETAKKARTLQGKSGVLNAEEIGSLCQAVADDLESGAITEDGLVGKVKDNYAKKLESTPSPKKATPEAYETESVTIYTGKKKTPKNAEGKYIGDMNGTRLIAVDGSYYSQNGRTFVVNAESGAVVANGNSFESAVNKVRSNSEFVEASHIEEDTDTTEDTVSPENDIPDEDIAEEDIAATDEEDAVEETAEETDDTDYRTAPNIQNEEEYKSLPRKAKAHAVIGRSIAESDFENDIIEMGLDADNSGARNIANSLRNNSDMSDVTRYVALGDLASRLGVTKEQIVKSKARSLAFQFVNAISSESGATFAERVEAAIPNARKTATARNDRFTLDALGYLESVVSKGGTAVSELVYRTTDTRNFTKENPNIAVERYAQKMQSALRASGTKINVVVAYDMPIGARGDWTTKNGVTTIRLNGKALRGEASAFWVMSHELLHEAETHAPGITDRILDTFEDMGIYTDGMYEAYRQRYKSSYEAAYKGRLDSGEINQAEYDRLVDRYVKGEIAADLMSECFTSRDMLEMFAGKLTVEDRNIIVRFLKKIVEGLKKAFGETDAYTARFEAIVSEFENAIKSGSGTNVGEQTRTKRKSLSSIGYSFFGNESISADEVERMLKDGSYKDYEGYKKYVEDCVKVYKQAYGNATEADIAQIEKEIEGIMRVAVAAKRAGYDIFDSGAKRNTRDSKNRLLFSSLEPNSDYITSSDISAICDKRKSFAEIYDEIVRIEEERNVPPDKRFFSKVDNYFILHKMMAEKGLVVPCEECYVESMRKNLAPMANAFITLVKETNAENKSNAQLYNQSGKNKGKLKENNAKIREKVIEICAKSNGTQEQIDKLKSLTADELAKFIDDVGSAKNLGVSLDEITVEMLTTAEGLAKLKLRSPLLYEAFNSFYGQSKPKMPKEATPFRPGELIALFTDKHNNINQTLIDRVKSTGGFRLQSYSDFQIGNFVDVLQTIFEASMLGLNGHAYTKVPAFLQATEGTNLKRNLSIFMYDDGGRWMLDKKNSFPMELEDIYALVAEDESGNTSIIAVSQNAKMSAWVMANDLIGYSIPFHKSGLKMAVVRARDVLTPDKRTVKGYSNQIDHTKQQSEVYKYDTDGKKKNSKVSKPINIYSIWDFENKGGLSRNELIRKNLEAYIDKCEELGYLPKFRDYVMNNDKVLKDVLNYSKELGFVSEDATIDDISFEYKGYRIPYGYYKFLGDFGMFTPDGEASPIKPLSLAEYDFDKAVGFFTDSKKLRTNELLQQFENGAVRERYRELVEKGKLNAEQLEKILRGLRRAVVRKVVDREKRFTLSNGDLTSDDSTTSPDTRYALSNPITPEMEAEYLELAKNPEKNEARLREMVEEAAREAGYNSPLLYHGTPYFGFTQIDTKKSSDHISFFATDSIQVAGTYSGKKDVRRIGDTSESSLGTYQLYANTDGMLEFDANGAESNHIALGRMERAYNDFVRSKGWYAFATVKQLAKFAKNKGYTGVIIKNVVDTATPESRKAATPATDYIFFNPQAQVKSADLVTYDNDGNVIPLSERFNPESVDIRNALSNTEVLEKAKDDNHAIPMRNKIIKLISELSKRNGVSKDDKNIFNSHIMDALESILQSGVVRDGDIERIARIVYDYSREESADATATAKMFGDAYRYVYDFSKIYVPEDVRSEMTDYNDFRKSLGTLLTSKESDVSVGVAYKSLSEAFPSLFPVDIENDIDRLKKIKEVIERARVAKDSDTTIAVSEYAKYDEAKDDFEGMAQELIDNIFDVANIPIVYEDEVANEFSAEEESSEWSMPEKSFVSHGMSGEELDAFLEDYAKKSGKGSVQYKFIKNLLKIEQDVSEKATALRRVQKQASSDSEITETSDVTKAYEEYRAAVVRLRAVQTKPFFERAIDTFASEYLDWISREKSNKEKNKEKIEELKSKYKDRIKRIQEHAKEMREKRIEKHKRSKAQHRLLRVLKRLKKSLKTSDNARRAEIEKVLADFDVSAVSKNSKKLEEKKAWYEAHKEEMGDDFIPIPHYEAVMKRIESKSISELTDEELYEVLTVAIALDTQIQTENKLLGKTKKRTVFAETSKAVHDVMESDGADYEKIFKGFGYNKITTNLLNPLRFIKKISGYNENGALVKLTQAIVDGSTRAEEIRIAMSKKFQPLIEQAKNLGKFTGKKSDVIEVTLKGEEGADSKTIRMLPSFRVYLYLASQSDDFKRHAAKGGIRFPNVDIWKKGDKTSAMDKGETIKLSPTELQKITEGMTEYEKKWAETADEFFNGDSKEYVNETSLELLGYEIANVDRYCPIVVNPHYITGSTEFKEGGNASVENPGFAHERVTSHLPVYACDIADLVVRHIDEVSKYAGLAVPVVNFKKVYNAKVYYNGDLVSLKDAIARKWGNKANSYIRNFLNDLANPRRRNEGIESYIRSGIATTALATNISVALGNYEGYLRGAAVLGKDAILEGLRLGDTADESVISKYTPILDMRKEGFSTMEIGDISAGAPILKSNKALRSALSLMQKVDIDVTKALWKASEAYVRKNFPEYEVGNERYYKEVAKVFNDTIRQTQPNYNIAERPELFRRNDTLAKTLGMFRSALVQNFGLLYENIDRTVTFGRKVKRLEAKLKKENANTSRELEQTKKAYENSIESANRAIAATIAGNIFVSVVEGIVKGILLGKIEYRDEDEKLTLLSFIRGIAMSLLGGITGMIPGLEELTTAVGSMFGVGRWYDINTPAFDWINDVVASTNKLGKATSNLISGETHWKTVVDTIADFAGVLSVLFKIPVSSIYNQTTGLICTIAEDVGYIQHGEHYARYIRCKFREDGYKSDVKAKMCRIAFEAKESGDLDAYKAIKEDMIKEHYSSEATFDKKIKSLESSVALEEYGRTFEKVQKNSDSASLGFERYSTGESAFKKEAHSRQKDVVKNAIKTLDGLPEKEEKAGLASIGDYIKSNAPIRTKGRELAIKFYDKTGLEEVFDWSAEPSTLSKTTKGKKEEKTMNLEDYFEYIEQIDKAEEYSRIVAFGTTTDMNKHGNDIYASNSGEKWAKLIQKKASTFKKNLSDEERLEMYNDMLSDAKSEIRADWKERYFQSK